MRLYWDLWWDFGMALKTVVGYFKIEVFISHDVDYKIVINKLEAEKQ